MIDISGQRYGKLTVISFVGMERKGNAKIYRWLCQCDCGNTKVVSVGNLRRSNPYKATKSCGCGKGKGSTRIGNRLPAGEALINSLYSNYKFNAKNRDLAFELSKEEFKRIINLDCFYCGDSPSGIKSVKGCVGTMIYNGIDRLDSDVGYIEGNVVPCCKQCNIAKNDTPYKKFKNWILRVSDHLGSKEIMYAR